MKSFKDEFNNVSPFYLEFIMLWLKCKEGLDEEAKKKKKKKSRSGNYLEQ